MKLFILLWIAVGMAVLTAQGQEQGCAILFDNSGSMVQYFTKQQMLDAEQLVLDLALDGKVDETKWEVVGDRSKLKPLWQTGQRLYLHAFGQLTSDVEPFFRIVPSYGAPPSRAEAERVIRSELLDYLDFGDNFTHIELARNLAWWTFAGNKTEANDKLFMNVLTITDGVPDQLKDLSSAGNYIRRAFTSNGIQERHVLRFEHRVPSLRDPQMRLAVQLDYVGPHFYVQSSSTTPSDTTSDTTVSRTSDAIRFTQPRPNTLFDGQSKVVNLQWIGEGDFSHYLVEVLMQAGRGRVLQVSVGRQQQARLDIARQLMPKLKELHQKEYRLMAVVRGVYQDPDRAPLVSGPMPFRIAGETPTPWGFIWAGIGALTLGGLFAAQRVGLVQRLMRWLRGLLGGDTPADNDRKSHGVSEI